MYTFAFKIVTPEKVVFEADIAQATLPTEQGEVTVLPHHIPMIGILKAGEVTVKIGDREESIAVSGGFIEVTAKKVILLADTADMAHEIDEKVAAEAHERAQHLLAAKTGQMDRDYAALQVIMDREFARMKVARKYKQRKNL